MYLKQKRMARGQGELDQSTSLNFVDRVVKLPMVHVAWDYATNSYTSIKESNRLVNFTLTNAERSVNFVAVQAKPVVMKFEKQIQAVDHLACKGLGTLEEKVPLITKSPEEILVDTKKLYTTNVYSRLEAIRQYGHNKVQSVTDYGLQKASFILENRAVSTLLNSVDSVLVLTENCVDYILPPEDANNHMKNGTSKDDEEKRNTLSHLLKIYQTIRIRAPRVILIQLRNIGNTPNAMFTLAVTRLESTIVLSNSIWEALTADEPRKDAQLNKLPFKRLIVLSRPFTKRAFDIYSTLSQLIFGGSDKIETDSNVPNKAEHAPFVIRIVQDNITRVVGIIRVIPSLLPMYVYYIVNWLGNQGNVDETNNQIDGSVPREENNLGHKTVENNYVHKNNISPNEENNYIN